MRIFLIALCAGAVAPTLQAQSNGSTPGAIRTYSTTGSIGIEWDIAGDADHDAVATVEFRAAGTTAWRPALPLVRVDYNGANMLAGSILFLSPNTTHEVRLTLADPDGGAAAQTWRCDTAGPAMPGRANVPRRARLRRRQRIAREPFQRHRGR